MKAIMIALFCLLTNIAYAIEAEDDEIAYQATDPLSLLEKLEFEEEAAPKNFGSDGSSSVGYIEPVFVTHRNAIIPWELLTRFKIPFKTTAPTSSSPSRAGTGDTQFLNLFVIQQGSWGRWGIGPICIFPTASNNSTGDGKWQIGPAFGISYLAIPKWQFVILAQNPISFAGSKNRSNINRLYFQPIVTHHLGRGWYLKSDAEWKITWSDKSVTIPLNIGLGRAFKYQNYHFDLATYAQFTVYQKNNTTTPQTSVKIEFSILFPK